MRPWWKRRTWAAKIALAAALLAGLLLAASMAIEGLQDAFVSGYTPPDLLYSDITGLDEVGIYAFFLSGLALLVSLASGLVAGLLGWARAVWLGRVP
jgi:hypothetical protein